jgi:hypothetical protein
MGVYHLRRKYPADTEIIGFIIFSCCTGVFFFTFDGDRCAMREFTVAHNSTGDYEYNGKWKVDFFKQLCMLPLRTIYSDYIQPLPRHLCPDPVQFI